MKIGVCVPCHPNHFKFLERLILSIENQTYKPHIVCISLSGVSNIENIPKLSTTFDLKMIYNSGHKNAGENRNISANYVKDLVDVISFFDADDFMHPHRLESINNAFEKRNCDAFMHNFRRCMLHSPSDILVKSSADLGITENIIEKYDFNGICIRMLDDNNKEIPTANGHISIKSSIFSVYKVPENMLGCEDSIYTKTLSETGHLIVSTPDILSLYCCMV